MLTSPHGDDGYGTGVDYKIFAHLWEYYMTGAFGEEIVQYKGFQTAGTIENDVGRRVYLGAYRYRAGGELQIRPDGKKELNITDNNGSVRLVVIQNSTGFDTLHYDYKPFGDTLWTSAGTMNRDNFDGSTYDSESDLQMLGFRMYDNETGRFTTPDLLWSAFPAQTPYQYAYNSPLTYRDPSGLPPEKEKEGEELLFFETNWDKLYPYYAELWEENVRRTMYHLSEAFNRRILPSFCPGGGSRTAATYTFNRISLRYDKPGGSIVGVDYHYTTHIPTSSGTLNVPTTVQDNAISDGETSATVMDAFVSGLNEILRADANFFNHLYGRDIKVDIMHSSNITANGKPAIGKESGIANGSIITLAGDILTGQTKPIYKDGKYAGQYGYNDAYRIWQNYAYIGHEFAHAVHRTIAGTDFLLYSSDLKEHYAAKAENSLRSYYGDPLRYHGHGFSMGFINKNIFPGTWKMWDNYLKRGY